MDSKAQTPAGSLLRLLFLCWALCGAPSSSLFRSSVLVSPAERSAASPFLAAFAAPCPAPLVGWELGHPCGVLVELCRVF